MFLNPFFIFFSQIKEKMPPNPTRVPVRRTSRRFSVSQVPVAVYLGVDIELRENSTSYYSISVHDGMYCTDYYEGELFKHTPETSSTKEMAAEAFAKLHEIVEIYSLAQNFKVQIVACSHNFGSDILKHDPSVKEIEECTSIIDYWRNLDALPFRVQTNAESSDERASAAVRKAVMWYSILIYHF